MAVMAAKAASSRTRRAKPAPAAPATPAKVSRRGRAAQRPYPHYSFEEVLEFAAAIQKMAGSNTVRRLTVFHQLNKGPESSASRQLIVAAGKYGLIKGGVQSETLQLTPDGDVATSTDVSPRERARARIKLAIESVEIFKTLADKYSGQKLPSIAILEDAAVEAGIPEHLKKECIEIFVVNLRFVGLLQTLSGAERILTVDHALDSIPSGASAAGRQHVQARTSAENPLTVHSDVQFDRICFYIGPIGDPDSDQRKHSDLILETLVRPAMEQFGIEVKRADEIHNPGLINKQIFEYLLKSRLAIADLSYHNPNVFYELAIRHARNLPTVQMIRKADRIPFDINQNRTVVFDTTDLYSFVPKIETYRLEISNHIRSAMDDPASAENPLSAYYPDMHLGPTKGS
ncbi:hypothetical protein [Mesorhizobium muleiense]|nr:hypothetical protein [Mesorhizobium muleiense]